MKITSSRRREERVSFIRYFSWADQPDPHSGFGLDCNEHGEVDEDKLNPCALDCYRSCVVGEMDGRKLIDQGVEEHKHSHTIPAVGECENCGREVELYGFTNTCYCGADYNMSGQRLADRSQWGEETSETVADILMADTDPFGGC